MRSRLMLALAPIVGMLGGCNAPSTATISITNNSGQRISFESCRHKRFDLAPGDRIELRNTYRAIAPLLDWGCYRNQPLTVTTERGETWRYTLWFNPDFVPAPESTRYFSQFSGPDPRTGPIMHSWVVVGIAADGGIHAGRRVDPESYANTDVVFPDGPEPPGFPIMPK